MRPKITLLQIESKGGFNRRRKPTDQKLSWPSIDADQKLRARATESEPLPQSYRATEPEPQGQSDTTRATQTEP